MIFTVEKVERRTKDFIFVRFKNVENVSVGLNKNFLAIHGIQDLHTGDKVDIKGRQSAKVSTTWGMSELKSIKLIK